MSKIPQIRVTQIYIFLDTIPNHTCRNLNKILCIYGDIESRPHFRNGKTFVTSYSRILLLKGIESLPQIQFL